jgi:hypothetical protein
MSQGSPIPLPPPPRPLVVRVAKPTIGGKDEYDYKEMAWTGGKPNYDWTDHETHGTEMASPNCWRQANPVYESKAYTKQTEPRSDETKFEKDQAEPTLNAFAKRVKNHMVEHGMDSIFYVQDPTNLTTMVSVLDNYQLVTPAHVHAEGERLVLLFDKYDKKNNRAAKTYLRASFGPKILAKLDTRDPNSTMTAAEVFMLAADKGTAITPQEIDLIKKKMKELSPMGFPGQNVSDYCTAIRQLKLDLDNAGAYEQSITSQILLQLNQVTVESFRIGVTLEKKAVDKTLLTTTGLPPADQLTKMRAAKHTLEEVLEAFEDEYRGLVKVGQWDPAKNKTDKKAPGINPGSTMDEINAFIKSKVQSEFTKMRKTHEKDESPKGEAEAKADETPKKDKKDAVCFACGKKGHFKGEGKCKPEDIAEHEKERKYPPIPGPNDPKELMWKGKKRFWCAKCGKNGRWTMKHTTETHVDDFKKPEANTFCVPVSDDEEVPSWHEIQW